ncbi:MAG: hypothetical protein DRJ40_10735 [Thermoprotei archaeon]|nr:MAG: hypothetical protein DRJ40_10735 [Thermoprotei archaeon]
MGLLDREVTFLGITMELRYWILGLIFLALAILGIVLRELYSSPIVDILSATLTLVGTVLSVMTWITGSTKKQISTLTSKVDELRLDIISELRAMRRILEEIRDLTRGSR